MHGFRRIGKGLLAPYRVAVRPILLDNASFSGVHLLVFVSKKSSAPMVRLEVRVYQGQCFFVYIQLRGELLIA